MNSTRPYFLRGLSGPSISAGIALSLALATFSIPQPTRAFEADLPWIGSTSLDFTNTLLIRLIDESFGTRGSSEDILTILNKMNAIVSREPITLGVRFDMAYFPLDECSWVPVGQCQVPGLADVRQDYTQIEKIFATWNYGFGSTTAGDFYASFGRGLTLSVRKADELGLDTTIRGAKTEGRVGPWFYEALGGTVNAHNLNLAQARDVYLRDPDDAVLGMQTGFLLDGGVEVAVRGVHYRYARPSTLGHEEWAGVAGASFSLLDLGPFALVVEGAVLRHEDRDPMSGQSKTRDGSAVYAQLTGQFGDFSALVEFKYYDSFELAPPEAALRNAFIRYHEPPTLERIDQLVPSFSDALGGRLLLEYFVPSTYTRVYANFVGYAYGKGLGADPTGDNGGLVLHGYAGVAQQFGPVNVEITGGYREELNNRTEQFDRTLIHGEIDISAPLGGPHALAFKWWHRSEQKRLFDVKSFELGLATLTYSLNPGFKFSVLYGYNTEFVETDPVHYAAGQFDWLFWNSNALRVFGGSMPGGIVCAGGTCVQVPAASIYSLQLVTRF